MTATIDTLLRPTHKRQDAGLRQRLSAGRGQDPGHDGVFWRRVVRIGDFTAAAALNQTIDLFADLTATALAREGQSGEFPGPVWINTGMGPYVRTITDFAGGGATSVTAEVGDQGDTDGLVTASSVFTGVGASIIWTPAAAQYGSRYEATFAPVLRLVSDVNIDTLTAGSLEVVIPYIIHPRDID